MSENGCAALYRLLTETLIARGLTVSTMESCTAGEIVSLLTDTEGSSAVVRGGLVTYCNDAKTAFGISAETIARYGVYSAETALAMARNCMEKFGTDIGIGVTGSFANPDPDNADSVPGTVFYALNFRGTELAHRIGVHTGARHDSKTEVAEHIARELLAVLEQNGINRKGGGDQ